MIGAVIFQFDDLRKLSGLGERAHLASIERWARSQGIPIKYDAKGGCWTTLTAMNAALGLEDKHHDAANEPYTLDQVV